MTRLSLRLRLLAACLAFLAGFVDALGFIHLGGYFTSFMTGNSTRMAVGVAELSPMAALPAGLIALFVAGVVAGSLMAGPRAGASPRLLLATVAGMLALASALAIAGFGMAAVLLTPFAMGAMNTVLQRDGEISFGVTYMTGALVKLGQRVAIAISGGERWGWVPFLLLWAALLLGAICGAVAYPWLGLSGLLVPAAALALLALLDLRPNERRPVA